eukprot:6054425-Prymnesium_polylepis.1
MGLRLGRHADESRQDARPRDGAQRARGARERGGRERGGARAAAAAAEARRAGAHQAAAADAGARSTLEGALHGAAPHHRACTAPAPHFPDPHFPACGCHCVHLRPAAFAVSRRQTLEFERGRAARLTTELQLYREVIAKLRQARGDAGPWGDGSDGAAGDEGQTVEELREAIEASAFELYLHGAESARDAAEAEARRRPALALKRARARGRGHGSTPQPGERGCAPPLTRSACAQVATLKEQCVEAERGRAAAQAALSAYERGESRRAANERDDDDGGGGVRATVAAHEAVERALAAAATPDASERALSAARRDIEQLTRRCGVAESARAAIEAQARRAHEARRH